jgi:hypothetical protein
MDNLNLFEYIDHLSSIKEKCDKIKELKKILEDNKRQLKKEQKEMIPYQSKQYNKQMYEKHKDKVLKYMGREIECECGLKIRYSNNKHKFTNRHLFLLEQKKNNQTINI